MYHSITPLLLFMLAVSVDSLSAGFVYGSSKVKVKLLSAILLVFIPSVSITLITGLGSFIFSLIPPFMFSTLSFTLLFILGCEKLIESVIRHFASRFPDKIGNWACKIKQMNIIFTIYFSPEDANKQDIQILNAKEAFFLSLALSLDSMIASMAFSCQAASLVIVFALAAIFHFAFFFSGFAAGALVARKSSADLSWLSGAVLLLLSLYTLLNI